MASWKGTKCRNAWGKRTIPLSTHAWEGSRDGGVNSVGPPILLVTMQALNVLMTVPCVTVLTAQRAQVRQAAEEHASTGSARQRN